MEFIAEDALRAQLTVAAARKAKAHNKAPDPVTIENWVRQCLARKTKEGALITQVQFDDLRNGRVLQVGDEARYVGPTRVERTDHGNFERTTGQLGSVVRVTAVTGSSLIVWRPYGDGDVVELIVATGTPGYFTLERCGVA